MVKVLQDAFPWDRGGDQEVGGGRLRVPPSERVVPTGQERELRHPCAATHRRRRALQDQCQPKKAGRNKPMFHYSSQQSST